MNEMDKLLAADLESFTEHFFTKMTPQEQIALGNASRVINDIINERPSNELPDQILSLFEHRPNRGAPPDYRQPVWVQPEEQKGVPDRR